MIDFLAEECVRPTTLVVVGPALTKSGDDGDNTAFRRGDDDRSSAVSGDSCQIAFRAKIWCPTHLASTDPTSDFVYCRCCCYCCDYCRAISAPSALF